MSEPALNAALHPETQRSSLLIVDDRAENRSALRATLEPIGASIVEATSGDEALRELLAREFALILLDVDMPEMNGFQTAELIKRHPRTANIPIIFLTAYDDLLDRADEGYEFGAVDYIAKPSDPSVLRAKVRVFLELHDKTALLQRQTYQLEQHVDQLRASRSALADAQRIAKLGSWEYDPKTGRVRGSRQLHEIFGEDTDAPLPTAVSLFGRLRFRPDDTPGDVLIRSTTPMNFEGQLIRRDGVRRQVVVHAEPKVDTLTLIGTVQDVTDQREAERAFDEVSDALRRERELVHMFQQTFVAPSIEFGPDVQISCCYRPAESAVGGDFYDAVPVDDQSVILAIGDVAGHGLGAASVMSEIRTALRSASMQYSQPGRIVQEVDRYLTRFHRNTFATMLVVRFDRESGACTMACAGHLPPLVAGDGFSEITSGPGEGPLGLGLHARGEISFVLERGRSLLLYTDGLVERRDEIIDEGIDRLRHALSEFEPDAPTLAEDVVQAVCGDTQLRDDVAVLALHRHSLATTLDVSRPARTTELAELRGLAGRWLRSFDADQECVDDIVLALCEVVANSCIHAYGLGTSGRFQVHGELHGDEVTFSVRDSGTWRAAGNRSGGRGLRIAEALVQQLSIDRADDGTAVTLVAKLR